MPATALLVGLTVLAANAEHVRVGKLVHHGPSLRAAQPLLGLRGGRTAAPKELAKASAPAATDTSRGLLGLLGGIMIHLACGSMYCWGNLVSYLPPDLKYWGGAGGTGPADGQMVNLGPSPSADPRTCSSHLTLLLHAPRPLQPSQPPRGSPTASHR